MIAKSLAIRLFHDLYDMLYIMLHAIRFMLCFMRYALYHILCDTLVSCSSYEKPVLYDSLALGYI